MHGRPRKAKISEEDEEASAAKASKLRSLQSQFLQFHQSHTYTKEALEVSAKLLELNPEYYTAWNYRKLAVENCIATVPDSIGSFLDEELKVVESALRRNYKAYGAWHHRKWVLSKGHSSTDRELALLAKFQKADARNFHAWNYRRFITKLKNVPDTEELEYTSDVIYDNFSNYSAWHNRSVLLSSLLEQKAEGYFPKEKVFKDEFEFVRNAIFTDPDDQSGWFYHLWLLDQTLKTVCLSVSSWPPHSSNIHVSSDTLKDVSFDPSESSAHGTLPLILYFSKAVDGVNSGTVAIQSEYINNKDFFWRPVKVDKSGLANIWITCLKFPIQEVHPSKTYQVKVSIAHSEGITTASTGIQYSHPSDIAFTVCLLPHGSEGDELNSLKRIHWAEENHHSFFEPCREELDCINSSYQVTITNNDTSEAGESKTNILAEEIAYCRELLSEIDCKIGKLTLARLLMAHDALVLRNGTYDLRTSHYKEVLKLYEDLMILDPSHFQYYKDQHSLVFLMQETLTSESLLRYCRHYRDDTCSSISKCICLCLNNLSISRIGCFERFLWVRMLDVSHNELRSIEGLEAMQLLCCLNLSNNKLCSFSALEPLRTLESLKVLDVSFNEIGAHSVDTRRYLFESPLSYTVASGWDKEEALGIDAAEITNYWEAFLVFRGLKLRQLDILGNPVVDEKFKLFLHKLLPALRWLDDENLS